jgi:hypothetical protein
MMASGKRCSSLWTAQSDLRIARQAARCAGGVLDIPAAVSVVSRVVRPVPLSSAGKAWRFLSFVVRTSRDRTVRIPSHQSQPDQFGPHEKWEQPAAGRELRCDAVQAVPAETGGGPFVVRTRPIWRLFPERDPEDADVKAGKIKAHRRRVGRIAALGHVRADQILASMTACRRLLACFAPRAIKIALAAIQRAKRDAVRSSPWSMPPSAEKDLDISPMVAREEDARASIGGFHMCLISKQHAAV